MARCIEAMHVEEMENEIMLIPGERFDVYKDREFCIQEQLSSTENSNDSSTTVVLRGVIVPRGNCCLLAEEDAREFLVAKVVVVPFHLGTRVGQKWQMKTRAESHIMKRLQNRRGSKPQNLGRLRGKNLYIKDSFAWYFVILQEYYPYTLKEYLFGAKLDSGLFSVEYTACVLDLMVGVARGLSDMHEAGELHNDIKAVNVCVREDGTPVVIDFGLSGRVDRWNGNSVNVEFPSGSPLYFSSEKCVAYYHDEINVFGFPADIYALGLLMYGCCNGFGTVWKGGEIEDDDTLYAMVVDGTGELDWNDEFVFPTVRNLVDRLTCLDPCERPDAKTSVFLIQKCLKDILKCDSVILEK